MNIIKIENSMIEAYAKTRSGTMIISIISQLRLPLMFDLARQYGEQYFKERLRSFPLTIAELVWQYSQSVVDI